VGENRGAPGKDGALNLHFSYPTIHLSILNFKLLRMAESEDKDSKGKCTLCETYNMKGTWTCECGAVNISREAKCWKCGRLRFLEQV